MSEVENCIRNNWTWNKLPKNVKQLLGNSPREYEKLVLEHSVKNQLRFKGNLIRHVKKNEEHYYDLLLEHSRSNFMLYPYHLSDIVVNGLRTTPFQYYILMMQDLMAQERSYDSLPNFTAADCLRLLGIGRNQYIELMNQCRATKKMFRRKPIRDILPQRPVEISIEPWWIVQVGNVLEDDIKGCSKGEKDVIDIVIDDGPQLVGTLDASMVQKLYIKGLVYFDVPLHDSDNIIVPPLDGFVMNRVLGDYFETLLYKIFVSIDEHTTVEELSNILQIDSQLVKNAISVFCRLGFARKRVTGLENLALHVTWAKHMHFDSLEEGALETLSSSLVSPSVANAAPFGDDEEMSLDDDQSGLSGAVNNFAIIEPVENLAGRRIGFLFDSTLTAFLMMGNLSNSLKSHAVTLFEVGKLADESLDNFIEELKNVRSFGEGEAQRYYDHAQALKETIVVLREQYELDLLRCESLMALDCQSRLRVLQKNYQLLVSMAPLTNEIAPVNCCDPPQFGPPISEVNSPWFRLFLYELLGQGPTSILLTKGTRLRRLPEPLSHSKQLLLCTWSHEPGLVSADTCLQILNETLQNSAVFLQEYSDLPSGSEIVHIAFPLQSSEKEILSADQTSGQLFLHPTVQKLQSLLFLNHTCGYVTLLRTKVPNDISLNNEEAEVGDGVRTHNDTHTMTLDLTGSSSSTTRDPRKVPCYQPALHSIQNYEDWILFDFVFGLPLFDQDLNRNVCANMIACDLFDNSKRSDLQETNRKISLMLLDFIKRFQPIFENGEEIGGEHRVPYPLLNLIFRHGTVSEYNTG